MNTTVDEIGSGIYRISTWIPEIAPPDGFTFNQFLIDADEPMLFHCGSRQVFPLVSEAVARVMPVDRIRWISFGHVESDECGAMGQWLQAAPHSTVAYNALGCMLSVEDMADRPPRPMGSDDVLDLGGKRVRMISTPHVPHNWEAQVLHEETTGTLFCGDLLTHFGGRDAMTTGDLLGPALASDEAFGGTSLTPSTAPTIRGLADLEPTTLALMHGSSFRGDGGAVLRDLAGAYEEQLVASVT
jgi:flavorubredoxin